MRLLVFGNSGSGKSTYAKAHSKRYELAHLDLDTIVWEPGKVAVQRAPKAIADDLNAFISNNLSWVIEGCYGELVAQAAHCCTLLVFLNPGLGVCLANNQHRPWEPHKYKSASEQNAMLEHLQSWVRGYYGRDDQWSYRAHRRLFDDFVGEKIEHTQRLATFPSPHATNSL